MGEPPTRRMTLLAAYEDYTRKEGVCLDDGNFDRMLLLQGKKRKVMEALAGLAEVPFEAGEREAFQRRVAALQERERGYAERLAEKMGSNRDAFRKLNQNAVSASKLRKAYAAPRPAAPKKGTLDGRA